MAIIQFIGAVSSAHLNPAVSIAFAMRGDFPWTWMSVWQSPQASMRTSTCSSPGIG